jgi:hypothetical protein
MHRPIVELCRRLHVREVKAAIPHRALRARLDLNQQQVEVIGRLTNLKNGYRYFFLCPCCGKPHEALYCADFSDYRCRECAGLLYAKELRYHNFTSMGMMGE